MFLWLISENVVTNGRCKCAAWVEIGCGLMAALIVQKYENRVSEDDDKYDPSHMSKVMTLLLQSQLVPLLDHRK